MNTTDTDTSAQSISENQECVAAAAVAILNATCGIQFDLQANDDGLDTDGAIVGVISIVGGVEWSLFLGLPRDTATALAARFAGFEIPFESEDMGDAIGELTNILAGEVKTRLDGRGVKVEILLPSVIRAESLEVLKQHNVDASIACFASPIGKLWTGMMSPRRQVPSA